MSPDLYCSPSCGPRAPRAVSTTEMLVTLGLIALLTGLSFTLLSGARRSRAQAACAANLHGISSAFQLYLADNRDVYPAPGPSAQWEDLLRNYVHRNSFRCPADAELFESLGSSYDWRDTGSSKTTLSGRPSYNVRPDAALSYDALPGWHAQGKVQVLMADSSVLIIDQQTFFAELQRSPNSSSP